MDAAKVFLRDVRARCREYGIKLILRPSKTVRCGPGILCAGYFCATSKSLVVAKNGQEWLAVLVHEFSHMEQWIENCEAWVKEDNCGNVVLGEWLAGEEVKNIKKAINNIIDLEIDADKRAIRTMVEYDLPINTVTYTQKSNQYILSYRHILKTRKWDNNPNNEAFRHMPSKFMPIKYYRQLSAKAQKIFQEAA